MTKRRRTTSRAASWQTLLPLKEKRSLIPPPVLWHFSHSDGPSSGPHSSAGVVEPLGSLVLTPPLPHLPFPGKTFHDSMIDSASVDGLISTFEKFKSNNWRLAISSETTAHMMLSKMAKEGEGKDVHQVGGWAGRGCDPSAG